MDLRRQPPRRWSDSLAGMIWLPRLLDKVRAYHAGTLGTYAYPSSLDQSFMRRFHCTPHLLETWVREKQSDDAVAAAVTAHNGFTEEERLARSAQFRTRYGWAFSFLDRDDGYMPGIGIPLPKWMQAPIWRWYQRWSAHKAAAKSI